MAGIRPVQVSQDVFAIIKTAQKAALETDGAFDITMKPLVDLWKTARAEKTIPSKSAIQAARRKVGYQAMILDEREKTILLKKKGAQIDLGGIAKGYLLDRIREMITENGFGNGIINLGGTVCSIGEERNIGIRNPFTPMNGQSQQNIMMEVSTVGEDIVTSGVYEQFTNMHGKLYHHILDPHTGFPTDNALISVTLIGKNGAELDALATACFVLGLEEANQLIRKKQIKGIFVLQDGKVFYSEQLYSAARMKGD